MIFGTGKICITFKHGYKNTQQTYKLELSASVSHAPAKLLMSIPLYSWLKNRGCAEKMKKEILIYSIVIGFKIKNNNNNNNLRY